MGLLKRNSQDAAPVLGYLTGFAETYEVQRELGKGGNGLVRLAVHKQTGREYAVKSIPKVLRDPNASERKRASQIPYLRQEVEVLLALRGTLNVANLEEVYEDATHVHLVLEYCRGGELVGAAKGRHYSERTVASYLRAILRTVAQCHAKNIIHRDIKPENFLLLSSDEASPVKAIDFGLAMFFDPAALPVTGLNVEGTPWYLAPECCRAKWYPASDVWACGVMAAYLLTGHYPFVDRISPDMPDLARTLRHICFDPLDLSGKEWVDLSPEALDFVTCLLNKDPLTRPSARDALAHPWLASGTRHDRGKGAPLDQSVVQRLQRFGRSNLFKRTVLQHIAQDLVSMHFSGDPTAHGGAVFRDRSVRGGLAFLERSVRGGSSFQAAAAAARERSRRGGSAYFSGELGPALPEGAEAADSGDGGAFVSPFQLYARKEQVQQQQQGGGREDSPHRVASFPDLSRRRTGSGLLEKTLRGGMAFLERTLSTGSGGGGGDKSVRSGNAAAAVNAAAAAAAAASAAERTASAGSGGGSRRGSERAGSRPASFLERALSGASALGAGAGDKSVRGGFMSRPPMDSSVYLPVATPYSRRLADVLDKLGLKSGDKIDKEELTRALQGIGYHITDEEGAELFDIIDIDKQGKLGQAELSAGLMDWKAFQDTYKDRWLESVRRVFEEIDTDGNGTITADEIAGSIGAHLSPYEVDAAVHIVLLEATGDQGSEGAVAIDFDKFLDLLRSGDEALDNFDDRLSNHTSRHNTRDLTAAASKALSKRGSQKRSSGGDAGGGAGGGCKCCSIQ